MGCDHALSVVLNTVSIVHELDSSYMPLSSYSQLSKVVTHCLDQHRKVDCKYGRITCSDDFKYLARKVHVVSIDVRMYVGYA